MNPTLAAMTWRSKVLIGAIALLCGCAAPMSLDFDKPEFYQRVGAANDVDESAKGWGVYASLVGNQYLFYDDQNHLHEGQFEWFERGMILKHTTVWVPSDPRMVYGSGYFLRGTSPGEIIYIRPGATEPWRGRILADGSVRFTYMRGSQQLEVTSSMPSAEEWSEQVVDPATSKVMQTISASHRNSPRGRQILARLEQKELEKMRRSQERMDSFNSAMNTMSYALQGASQAYAESAPRYEAQPVTQSSSTASTYGDSSTTRQSSGGSQTKSATSPTPQLAAASTTTSAMSNSRSASSTASAPVREAPASNLSAFPEAIVVCTKPDANGRFECDTPVDVNVTGGPKDGREAWKTPESAVHAMDSCTAPRRLASSTHLVWGCGFGATGNSNTKDRSAGVDVAGRQVFYCYSKQTSCTKTSP